VLVLTKKKRFDSLEGDKKKIQRPLMNRQKEIRQRASFRGVRAGSAQWQSSIIGGHRKGEKKKKKKRESRFRQNQRSTAKERLDYHSEWTDKVVVCRGKKSDHRG